MMSVHVIYIVFSNAGLRGQAQHTILLRVPEARLSGRTPGDTYTSLQGSLSVVLYRTHR